MQIYPTLIQIHVGLGVHELELDNQDVGEAGAGEGRQGLGGARVWQRHAW